MRGGMRLPVFAVAVLALLGPVGLGAAAWSKLNAPPPPSASSSVTKLDLLAAEADWKTIVLGASFGNTDIDPAALHQAMGLPGKAVSFSIGASVAGVWYAVLKERVYGNSLSPDLVLMPVTIATALTTHLPGGNPKRLSEHMPEPDAAVLRRTYRSEWSPEIQRLLDRRSSLRDPLLNRFRMLGPSLWMGASEEALEVAGRAVFGETHAEAGARLLPVVEVDGAGELRDRVATADPAESYLADIVDLAESHGTRVVILLPPVAPGANAEEGLTAELERRMITWANSRGVGWLDLRREAYVRADFQDPAHMRPATATRFSKTVGERLVDMGLTRGAVRPAVVPILPSGVRRLGVPPGLPGVKLKAPGDSCAVRVGVGVFAALGTRAADRVGAGIVSPIIVEEGEKRLTPGSAVRRCSGEFMHQDAVFIGRGAPDAPVPRLAFAPEVPMLVGDDRAVYWVYPEGGVEWSFAEAWDTGGRAAPTIEARVLLIGGERASLKAGGEDLAFEQQGEEWVARLPVPSGAPWQITVSSEDQATFVWVRSLELVAGEERVKLVTDVDTGSVDLLLRNWTIRAKASAAVPPPPPASLKVARRSYFTAPWANETGCSPLMVTEDGIPLQRVSRDSPFHRPVLGAGVHHAKDRIYFDVADGSDPRHNGRSYQVVYDPERRCRWRECAECGVRVWLYPGDTLVSTSGRPGRVKLETARMKLRISGAFAFPSDAAAPLRLAARLGERPLVDTAAGVEVLKAGLDIHFSEAIDRSSREELVVELALTPDAPPLLVTMFLEAL